MNQLTGHPLHSKHGRHVKKVISNEAINAVRDHINLFPRNDSHYCRSRSSRQYLDANLNVETMYRMFCDNYEDSPPVKLRKYRQIFMSEFNLGFTNPRKDRCDKCEEAKVSENPSEQDSVRFAQHEKCKQLAKTERDKDRQISNCSHAVVCFDLENVIMLPKANIKNFFYMRKFAVYNMTAHCSLDKQGYCAIWAENLAGRTGNDMASAVVKLLDKIVENHPLISCITLWSDSCISQNKNRLMTLAILKFMVEHQNITKVVQKFGAAGHSSVQEVDNIHSQIDRKLRKNEVFSPVGFMKLLKTVDVNVIQMRSFTDYYSQARHIKKFSSVPFSLVQELVYDREDLTSVTYRTSFEENVQPVSVKIFSGSLPACRNIDCRPQLNKEKINDLEKMLIVMPPCDRTYYSSVITANSSSTSQESTHQSSRQLTTSTPRENVLPSVRREILRSTPKESGQQSSRQMMASTPKEKVLPSDRCISGLVIF